MPTHLASCFSSSAAAVSAILAAALVSVGVPPQLRAQQGSPSCANVFLSLVEKTVGMSFHDPDAGKAPPAYDGPWGTSCEFSRMEPFPQGQDTRIDFILYTEASAAVAKQTFDRVSPFLADKSKPNPGIGDASYWAISQGDEPTLHVLKGKNHFSLGMAYPADQKKLLALAAAIAAQL